MSFQSTMIAAFDAANVAGGKVYPNAAPERVSMPFVVYRKITSEPLMTLMGYAGSTKFTYVFECWADTYDAALALADNVRSAIDGAASLRPCYREQGDPDDYEPAVDSFVEPVLYSFWYSGA